MKWPIQRWISLVILLVTTTMILFYQNCSQQKAMQTLLSSSVASASSTAPLLAAPSNSTYGKINWPDYRLQFDNRKNPSGSAPYIEAIGIFNETKECLSTDTFNDCNSSPGLKIEVNPPRLPDNDWSAKGLEQAAGYRYNTHASGMYVQSFGRESVINSTQTIIPPSGIHLEPHGSHQGLRIDGSSNSGVNLRVDLSQGATGIAVYTGSKPSPYCDSLGLACDQTTLMHLRGGNIKFEDAKIYRSTSLQNSMSMTLASKTLGVEGFTHWHVSAENGTPVHCVFHSAVSANSIIRLSNYKGSKNLTSAHTYVIKDIWGPGQIPTDCASPQTIRATAGVYGAAVPAEVTLTGGFSVSILGVGAVLDAQAWPTDDRPSFMYEIFEPIK